MKQQWILASNNSGKLREIKNIRGDVKIDLIPQDQFGIEDVEETGLSFIENAILKARHASRHTGFPAIADDSGLEVFALQGEPGIFSARYAAADPYQGKLDQANVDKLLCNMQSHTDRRARFVCTIALIQHATDPTPAIFEGFWEGEISREISGDGGFGYDPIFYLPKLGITSAQLEAQQKNRLSHRGRALVKLKEYLKTKHDLN